jgi:RimJ/RimL family protein N-acetyltransferase
MNPPNHPHLRAWRDEDLAPFIRLHADPVVGYWLGGVWSEDTLRAAFDNARRPREDGLGRWPIVDERDELVGVAGLAEVRPDLPLHPAVEGAWRLLPRCWGRGWVTSSMRPILRRGFEQAGLEQIVALTARSNLRSQAVMRRLGFVAAPDADFDHPALAEDHPLRPHVVYKLMPSGLTSC